MGEFNSYQDKKKRYQSDVAVLLNEFNVHDQFAFRYIFETHYRAAILFAEGILFSQPEQAEDLVQDAFIKLWGSTADFNDAAQIKSFIYSTIKNACIDKIRHNKVAGRYQDHAEQQQLLQESDFIEPLITAETTKLIYEAIEALPEQGRNVFRMSLSGMKNDEIAAELHISVNTVKTHKQRALASLRANLGDAMLILLLLHYSS